MLYPVHEPKPIAPFLDYLPIVSTVSSLVYLFQEARENQRAASLIVLREVKPLAWGDQPKNRRWIALIPIIGNLALLIYDGIQHLKRSAEAKNLQAPALEKVPEECFKISCSEHKELELPLSAKTQLAKESAYFHTLFYGQFKEGQTHEYQIDLRKEDLETVLNWALGHSELEDSEQILNLFLVADSLSLVSLKAKMETRFHTEIHQLIDLVLESGPEESDWLSIFGRFSAPLRNALVHKLIQENFKDPQILSHLKPTELKIDVEEAFFEKLIKQCLHLTELKVPKGITNFSFIKDLPSTLTKLDLSNCEALTDEYLAKLSHLKNLISLDLNNCQKITDQALLNICRLETLTSLSVFMCQNLTDAGFQNIQNLKHLKSLNIGYCYRLSEVTIERLSGLQELVSLQFDGCTQFPLAAYEMIKTLAQLQILSLRLCNPTDGMVHMLFNLENLNELNLSANRLTEHSLTGIENLKQLKVLNLAHNWQIESAALHRILKLEQLTALNLSWCGGTNDLNEAFKLITKLKNLQSLQLASCFWVNSNTLIQISQLEHLVLLDLNGCEDVKKNFHELEKLKKLTHLYLNGCQIPKKALDKLARLPSLIFLRFENANYLTGEIIEEALRCY